MEKWPVVMKTFSVAMEMDNITKGMNMITMA
jgi:hypothetical protein